MDSSNSINIQLQKNRRLIPAIGVGVVCIILLGFSFTNITQGFQSRDTRLETQDEITDLQERIVKLEALESGELDNIENLVYLALPEEKPVFDSLTVVSALSKETEISVKNLDSQPGSVATPSSKIVVKPQSNVPANNARLPFEKLAVNLEVSGEVDGIRDFLTKILSSAPLMELNSVRISGTNFDDTTGKQSFSSELELEAYWQAKKDSSSTISVSSNIEQLSDEEINTVNQIRELSRY